ncbi:trypsin-1-like [Schistocerca serialis cubense]|uniref:trypsin-1-like n=1 Tax=Schistocerca serialis cubense TaxID=2023355 RepID=UPI00214EA943|nr:trypsin-1-like [Schistocerca serialis cubense]
MVYDTARPWLVPLQLPLMEFPSMAGLDFKPAPPGQGDSRVVNGTEAGDNEFPFMAQYVRYGVPECSATIINEYWVMTAGHCVDGKEIRVSDVRAGTNSVRNDTGVLIHVSEFVFRDNYHYDYINDVALIKLVQPLTLGPTVQPVPLPEQGQQTPGGTIATVVGWGATESESSAETLRKADIPVWSDADCQEAYAGYEYQVLEEDICAGMPEGGRGQCSGDGGGPLLVNGTQIGIVSWSRKPCVTKGSPGVYVEVSYYVDWIKEKTGRA